jgi:histidyl-tRNA synthetase
LSEKLCSISHLSDLDIDLTQHVAQIVEMIKVDYDACIKLANESIKQSREETVEIKSKTNEVVNKINTKLTDLMNKNTRSEKKIEKLSKDLESQKATNEFNSKLISGAKDEIKKLYK